MGASAAADYPQRFHVRIVKRPKGRPGYSGAHFALVGGVKGVNRTLCGADMTDHDIVPEEMSAATKPENRMPDWELCFDCSDAWSQAGR